MSPNELSKQQIALIQSTIPTLREAAVPITQAMYRRMFAANPEVAQMFNPSHMHPEGQQGALAGSIVAYAEHLHDPGALARALAVIMHKHVAVQVRPEQYAVVGGHLLAAISEVLGDAATPELIAAWANAYGFLAQVCIDGERGIYIAQQATPGGWSGLRAFRVVRKRSEGVGLASLWLRPEDGGALPAFLPGQHVSVGLASQHDLALRQYSLSERPGLDSLRLTVKAVETRAGTEPAVVSTCLVEQVNEGDRLDLTAPCGSFTLDPEAGDHSIVLLAGGVGITPLYSMAASCAAHAAGRKILLVHAARDAEHRPLRGDLRALSERTPGLELLIVHEQPGPNERIGVDYNYVGRVDTKLLTNHLRGLGPATTLECFSCGPHEFMCSVDAILGELGVPSDRRHAEHFGPARAI